MAEPGANVAVDVPNDDLDEEEEFQFPIELEPEEDADRMELLDAQRTWALSIKEAIEADPEADNLSDFWYAQLAIVDRNDLEEAMCHAIDMQSFRQEYDIKDNMEDAKKSVWEFMTLFENFTISFSYCKRTQGYIWVNDIPAQDFSVLVSEKEWRSYLAAIYYIHQAMNSDFLSINNGYSLVHECEGFDITTFGGLRHCNRFVRELGSKYPTRHAAVKFYNTSKLFRRSSFIYAWKKSIQDPSHNSFFFFFLFSKGTVVNITVSMIKHLLPRDMKAAFEVGLKGPQRLDKCFLVPDAKTAKLRNFSRIMEALKLRYDNQADFELKRTNHN